MINHNIELDRTSPYPQIYNYILCHKPFDDSFFGDISNKIFISQNGKVEGTVAYKSEYDDRVYGELGVWKWIATQLRDDDWACLSHYRRKCYAKMGVQMAEPIRLGGSVLDHLAHYHSPMLVEACSKALTPQELNVLREPILCPYNIFSAPKRTNRRMDSFRRAKGVEHYGCFRLSSFIRRCL